MKEQISILGCGWLGLPLAQKLLNLGHSVNGSTTQDSKVTLLKNKGIQTYKIDISPIPSYPASFFQSDRLVITLPFRRSFSDPTFYTDQIRSLISYLEGSPIQHIIFTSSTGVYPKDCGPVTESSPITPTTVRESALLETENILLDLNIPTTICRLAGLIGPGREPGKFLLKKQEVPNPDAPVNLIWQSDCLEIITRLLHSSPENYILNCVSHDHPTRRDFYTTQAEKLSYPRPNFLDITQSNSKCVDSDLLQSKLSFTTRRLDS